MTTSSSCATMRWPSSLLPASLLIVDPPAQRLLPGRLARRCGSPDEPNARLRALLRRHPGTLLARFNTPHGEEPTKSASRTIGHALRAWAMVRDAALLTIRFAMWHPKHSLAAN